MFEKEKHLIVAEPQVSPPCVFSAIKKKQTHPNPQWDAIPSFLLRTSLLMSKAATPNPVGTKPMSGPKELMLVSLCPKFQAPRSLGTRVPVTGAFRHQHP